MAIARSLDEAKKIGVDRYFPVDKCRNEHDSPRYTKSSVCVECSKTSGKKSRDKSGGKWQETRRKKYSADGEYRKKIRERNKESLKLNREKWNQNKRDRYHSDDEYREKYLAARRGRCQKDSQLRIKYGITKEIYDALLQMQNGACAICAAGKDETLCVDHCHKTGKVRGLLCRKCNTGLGCYQDRITLMHKAIKYLESNFGH